ncbi:hypothetical protein WJX72_001639 [[Myrmecia] bisecta]|uniref:Uncharacterized protein n=1 Tax=[Myrmecia] bisecta TaxID=41462 RepID=A0AAW1QB05_9CHLO
MLMSVAASIYRTGDFCTQAVRDPRNATEFGLRFLWHDFVAKLLRRPSDFQQGQAQASAPKARAFVQWQAFRSDSRRSEKRQKGAPDAQLHSSEHIEWNIKSAVAGTLHRYLQPPVELRNQQQRHPQATDRVAIVIGRSTRAVDPDLHVGSAAHERVVVLPTPAYGPAVLDSHIAVTSTADGALEQSLSHASSSSAIERDFDIIRQHVEPGFLQQRGSGVSVLGWMPHSWEGFGESVLNVSETAYSEDELWAQDAEAISRQLYGEEDRWEQLYCDQGLTGAGAGEPYQEFQRCNPWRWIHFHSEVLPNLGASGKTTMQAPRRDFEALRQTWQSTPLATFEGKAPMKHGKASVLVLFHYFEKPGTCPEDEEIQVIRNNLLYFLRVAVRANDGADYIINMGGRIDPALLTLIPPFPNVRVRFIESSTAHSDTCTFHKTLLEQGHKLFHQYKWFVLINNGMRGPFARAGTGSEKVHWTQPFISRLTDQVKLVGTYVSCEVETHVQGPFWLTDRVGVQVMLDILGGCWADHWADIVNGEVGVSQQLLASGYNIASLQHEYAGVDFRLEPERLKCRGKQNPTFCCGLEDPLQLHWVKFGGQVYRLGLIAPLLLRMVEDFTERTLALTPALVPNHRWQAPSPAWYAQQEAALQAHQAQASVWALTARVFSSVFSFSRKGAAASRGGGADASVRYIMLLGDEDGRVQFRYQLHPHMSGFETSELHPDDGHELIPD